jgi:hypothetical protein
MGLRIEARRKGLGGRGRGRWRGGVGGGVGGVMGDARFCCLLTASIRALRISSFALVTLSDAST